MSRVKADQLIYFLLGVLAGGTLLACFTVTTGTGAIIFSAVALAVWLVTFVVWLLWGSA
jgi:hypothetical protein